MNYWKSSVPIYDFNNVCCKIPWTDGTLWRWWSQCSDSATGLLQHRCLMTVPASSSMASASTLQVVAVTFPSLSVSVILLLCWCCWTYSPSYIYNYIYCLTSWGFKISQWDLRVAPQPHCFNAFRLTCTGESSIWLATFVVANHQRAV